MDMYIHSVIISLLLLTDLLLGQETTNGNKKDGDDNYSRSWGPWTEWSVCNKTCGYGTQYRIRRCHKLTTEKECHGPAKQFKICNSRPCPAGHQDYRTVECAKHNHIFYGTRRYRWVPYINDKSPCDLSCKSLGFGYYARFKKNVEEGVICNNENTAVCIQGKCLTSGCDGILGSRSKEDICGVCGGTGTTCHIISGIYTRTHLAHRGYNIVATIPSGARGINITEIGRSKNHLALSTPGGYFLNGNLRLQAEGEMKGGGTVFTYKRGRRHGCRGECLVADGPTNSTVRVELIYFGRNPGIRYSYAVPNTHRKNQHDDDDEDEDDEEDNADTATFSSQIQVKSQPTYIADRSTTPGRQQVRGRDTTVLQDRNRYVQDEQTTRDPHQIIRHIQAKIVSRRTSPTTKPRDSKINHNKGSSRTRTIKPAPRRKIINHHHRTGFNPKPYINATGDVHYRHYYHTSALDGLGDVPVNGNGRRVTSSYKPGWKWGNSVLDTSTGGSLRITSKLRPVKRIPDRSRPASAATYSSYNDNVIPNPLPLTDPDNSGGRISNTINATDSRDSNVIRRHHRRRGGSRDGVFSWRISGFTDCTEPCGGGLQDTRVVCIKADSQVEVMEENCDIVIKPETTTVVCNNQPCQPSWVHNKWTPCSVTCGRGLRKREVDCQQRISPTLTIPVSATTCRSPRPQSRQFCQLDPCYKWKPSNWSKCSTVCGFGQRSRTLTCVDTQDKKVKQHLCTNIKPSKEEICDMGSCAQGWFHSKWTKECSADCGRGYYVRKVYCSAPDGSQLDENKCGGSKKKPRETKYCKAPLPCGGQWFAGPWSKCNDTCGSNVVRRREVLCVKQHGKRVRGITKDHNCDENKKPAETEPCHNLPECNPQWYMMAWSNCSKSCDTGVRTREVICLNVDFTPSPDCDKKRKPSLRQSCNTQPCQQNFVEFSGSSKGGKTQILQQDGTIIEVPACEDKNGSKWCRLVSQARLCNYYKELCCHSCQSKG